MRPIDFFKHARRIRRRRLELMDEVRENGVIDTALDNPKVYSTHIALTGKERNYKL